MGRIYRVMLHEKSNESSDLAEAGAWGFDLAEAGAWGFDLAEAGAWGFLYLRYQNS